MVTDEMNYMLMLLISVKEIKVVVFYLKNDSAPGPDGFGAAFNQTFWEIIQAAIVAAVLQFFTTGWIPPGFNSNVIVLIPKTDSADSLDLFRPIAL